MRLIALLFSLILIWGCSEKTSQDQHEDQLDQAYRSIDRGAYDEAIADLEAVLSEQVLDEEARNKTVLALASAYAGRAGVLVQDFWGFTVGFKGELVNIEKLNVDNLVVRVQKVANALAQKVSDEDLKVLRELARTLAVVEAYQERIENIPTLKLEKVADLDRAIEVLQKSTSRGAGVYAAILQTVALKSEAQYASQSWYPWVAALEQLSASQLKCYYNLKPFSDWTDRLLRRLIGLASHLERAYPSESLQLKKSAQYVQQLRGQIKIQLPSQLRADRGGLCRE